MIYNKIWRVIIVEVISISDTMYPQQLKEISNPPKRLYTIGDITLLRNKLIAIIGSRNCSDNGKVITQKFASELSQIGITIISGMAKRY